MKAYLKVWSDYAMLVGLMNKMFNYLNSHYLNNVVHGFKLLSVTALDIFEKNFYSEVKDAFRTELFLNFTKDRNGEKVEKELMREVVTYFVQ